MKERLEQIYEKKYGIRLPSSDMLKKKSSSRRLKLTYSSKSDDELDPSKGRTVEDQRKRAWLTIARKDIPRVKTHTSQPKKYLTYVMCR
jgi:hypothetical protein